MAEKPSESRSRMHRLTPRFVATVKMKDMYPDGGGLYLQVGEGGGAKSWIFRYHVEGRGDRQMGLGPLHTIGLAEARERARKCREQRLDGIDPIDARNAERLAKRLQAAKQVTFHVCAQQWLKLNSPAWVSETADNRRRMITKHLDPVLGKIPVSAINVDLVESAIKPIWGIPLGRTALRNLEAILDWAAAKEYRQGDNPAREKGPLGIRLSPYVHIETQNAWLPYKEIGAFLAQLRARLHTQNNTPMLASYVLDFVILTAVRHHQARNLRWEDIDWDNKLWTCPQHKASKKTKRPHEIPLSTAAMAILKTMREQQTTQGITSEYVFVHGSRRARRDARRHLPRAGKKITGPGLFMFLTKRLGRPDLTVHGFRTTFSTWAHEDGRFEHNDIEMALGHAPEGNQVSHVYNQAKRLEPRRLLLEAWAEYCGRTEPLPAEVVPLRKAK